MRYSKIKCRTYSIFLKTDLNQSPRIQQGFLVGSVVKNLSANSGDLGDMGLSPRLGRFPGGGNGNSLKYFCLENPMDRGAWQTVVHGALKSQT